MHKLFISVVTLSFLLTSCSWNPFDKGENANNTNTDAEISETASTGVVISSDDLDKKTSAASSSGSTSSSASGTSASQTSTSSASSTTSNSTKSTSTTSSGTTGTKTTTSSGTNSGTNSGSSTSSSTSSSSSTTTSTTKTFNLTAKKWSFSPSTITVNKGDTVKITITSSDVTHGFFIPDFNVNTTISAGKTSTIAFVASKSGTFSFSCSVYCGDGHSGMTGTLIVK